MSVLTWMLAAALVLGNGSQSVPEAEQAFHLVAEQAAPGEVTLTIIMPPGVALYREQLGIEAVASAGFRPAKLEVEEGVVETGPDGTSEAMLRGVVQARVRGKGQGGTLRVRLRGCADAGICYPPLVRDVPIRG